MGLARELAERAIGVTYRDLPDEAIDWAKAAILDTIGVTLAGAREDCALILQRVLGNARNDGSSLVFGAGRTNALDAAQINGTASHALDYDDCSNTMGGHPSAPILPAIIAAAEETGASGQDILLAYIAGFETETKIALGVNFHHYDKGWHPTATLGTFGAAVGAARICGLSVEQTEMALALSVSLAAGVKGNFGTMTKPLHVGNSARNGLFAAQMAAEGFTASTQAFEHKQGFLNVFNGPDTFDPEIMLKSWGNPFDIVNPGVAIKRYPCCASTHPAIDAMLILVEKYGLSTENVDRIESWTHPARLAHTNRPDPQSQLDGKFSVQYCVARGLIHGEVTLEHFEGDSYRDPHVRKVMKRIHAAPHPDMPMASKDRYGAEIKATLTDGSVVSERVKMPVGRGPENPLPPGALEAKFLNCAQRLLSPAAAADLCSLIQNLENLDDIRNLTTVVAQSTSQQPTHPTIHQ